MCEDLLAGICGWWHISTLMVKVTFGEKWKEEERRENERGQTPPVGNWEEKRLGTPGEHPSLRAL